MFSVRVDSSHIGFQASDIPGGDTPTARANIDARRNRDNFVVVKTLSDLPTPSGGNITLADNTAYEINGTIDCGTNTITFGTNSRVFGVSRQTDVLKYTGSATFLLVGHALLMNDIGFDCASGTLLSCAASSTDRVRFHRCQFSGVKTLGSVTTGALLEILGCNIINASTNGFTISGSSFGIFALVDCYLENNTGTFLAVGSATFSAFKMENCIVKLSSGQTFISNTASTISFSSVQGNSFVNSGGTVLSGLTQNDSNWLFIGNYGLDDTQYVGENYMTGNATVTDITVAGTFVKIAGTTTSGQLANFTNPTSNKLQYTGPVTRNFLVLCRASFSCPNNNASIQIKIYKNGVAQDKTLGQTFAQTNSVQYNISCQGIISLAQNDYVEIYATNTGATNNDPTFVNFITTLVAS